MGLIEDAHGKSAHAVHGWQIVTDVAGRRVYWREDLGSWTTDRDSATVFLRKPVDACSPVLDTAMAVLTELEQRSVVACIIPVTYVTQALLMPKKETRNEVHSYVHSSEIAYFPVPPKCCCVCPVHGNQIQVSVRPGDHAPVLRFTTASGPAIWRCSKCGIVFEDLSGLAAAPGSAEFSAAVEGECRDENGNLL